MKFKLIYIELILMAMFWGISFSFTKIALQELSAISLVTIRFFFTALLFFPVLIYFYKKGHRIEKKDYLKIVLLALIGFNVYFILETKGLSFTDASKAALIINLLPIFTIYLSAKLLKEKTSVRQKISMVFALLGVYILVTNLRFDFIFFYKDIIGALFVSGAVIAAGLYDVFSKKILHKYDPLFLAGHVMVIGFFLFLPFYFFIEKKIITVFSVQTLISLLYLALVASFFAYWILYRAIKKIGVSRTTTFHYLIPLFAAIFAFFILKEKITIFTITGGLIIIGSVYVFSKGN